MRFLTHVTKQLNSPSKFFYKIADDTYCANTIIPELKALQNFELVTENKLQTAHLIKNIKYDFLTYNQKTLVGEKHYELEVKANKHNEYLLIADKNQYGISKKSISMPQKNDSVILLGPALILNLALNNVFCLHASACVTNNKAVVFLAQSGTGKSTIAQFIDNLPNHQRIADDIVPIKIVDGIITLLPNFPQLKLSCSKQYRGEDISLKTYFMFVKEDNNKNVTLSKLNHIESLKFLIKHTIATKLFSSIQLKSHLEFCHELFSKSESYQVSYQHKPDSLNELLNCINEL